MTISALRPILNSNEAFQLSGRSILFECRLNGAMTCIYPTSQLDVAALTNIYPTMAWVACLENGTLQLARVFNGP
jgi:hypothetical protein